MKYIIKKVSALKAPAIKDKELDLDKELVLIHQDSNKPAVIGEIVNHDTDKAEILGWSEPKNTSSSGRVIVKWLTGESKGVQHAYFPFVFGLEFIEKIDHETVADAKEEKKCVICGDKFTGHGNNPWPIKKEGQCCDSCNYNVVLPARIKGLKPQPQTKDAVINFEELIQPLIKDEEEAIKSYEEIIAKLTQEKSDDAKELSELLVEIKADEAEHFKELSELLKKFNLK